MRKYAKTKEALKRELIADVALWLCLIIFKATGIVSMSWPAVLSGCLWIPLLMLAFDVPFYLLFMCYVKAKRWWIVRTMRARGLMSLDAHAKIYGIRRMRGETDEQLRARIVKIISSLTKLDELAREDYNTTRLPGESDEELRRRLHEMVDNKHADTPTKKTPGRYAWESVNKEAET